MQQQTLRLRRAARGVSEGGGREAQIRRNVALRRIT